MDIQQKYIFAGLVAYLAVFVEGSFRERLAIRKYGIDWLLQCAGIVLFTLSIIHRWQLAGHGPFISMFEILLSNLFSLALLFLLASVLSKTTRNASVPASLVIIMLASWALVVPNDIGPLPPTYDNNWLWVHVIVGKFFLGFNLVATSLAITALWRTTIGGSEQRSSEIIQTDDLVWRFLALSFVFHSLMLIAGAVWAQDAWGRYWNWDPLETWAFATWLAIVLVLHARIRYNMHNVIGWLAVVCIFMLAFFTFLGVPFISTAPHKGAV